MHWKKRITVLTSLLLLLVAIGAILWPLLQKGFFVSDDGGWMIIRLSAFYQSFREGQFPVRFLGRLNYGYGYPVANFLYPGFMYIGSVIHLFGFSFINSVKIIIGGSVVTAAVFTYLWLRKYFNVLSSVVGTFVFISAPYLLFDIYHRGSVGEVLAVAWAAMGFYSIAAKKRWLFGLTIPLLILAHNSLAFLFLGVYVLYITIAGAWPQLWFMFGAGIGMGAFFWLPALYERKYVIFDSVAVADPRDYLITMQNAVLLGASGILASAASLFTSRPPRKEKFLFMSLFVLTLVFVLPLSAALWQWQLLVHIIQFPYRLLSVTLFIGAWLAAYVLARANRILSTLLIVLFMLFGIWSICGAVSSVAYVNQPDGYYSTNEATTNVADEYMPKWVTNKPTTHAPERLVFYHGKGTIVENSVSTETMDVEVKAAEDSVIQINTLYYPGWGATVDDTKVHIDYSNNEDLMRIPIPAGHHHLIVAFRETISRFLADCLSLASFVVYIVALVLVEKHKPKKK